MLTKKMRPSNALAGTALLYTSVLATDKDESSGGAPQFHNSARHAGADPYAFYDAGSGQYYAYSTEGADEGSNFAIYSSPDLSTWHKQPGGVFKACYDDEGNPLEGGQACWARDWLWAPEAYHNAETGWYFFFFAGRLREDLAKDYFRYPAFEEPSKIGVAVSRSPTGPFREIESRPIDYYPFDPDYHDVNLIMDEKQMLPPQSRDEGETAPKGTFIPTIDPNVFFDEDGRIYLYTSRNAYRNWNWDAELGKYIEESNIIVVELERDWWDDPDAATMPEIAAAQRNARAADAPQLPCNITSYNGTGGELGNPPRKDGWHTVISYGADPQEWENFHVNDYATYNGTKKDRRWAEGSTTITRPSADADADGKPVYLLLYSANNYEASNYGVGFATAASPLGPFHKSSANPVLSQLPDADIPIYSTGHGSIVASPPPRSAWGGVGAQDVTHRTPDGSELFYVHHARNDTARDRSIYTTRMTLDAAAVRVGSDGGGDAAITMHLTPLDQPLPRGTYPIKLDARCSGNFSYSTLGEGRQQQQLAVRVRSRTGAPFDLAEDSNWVVALPGSEEAVSVAETGDDGSFLLEFGDDDYIFRELAYQRLGVDGSWSTIALAP
ncbi:hypothetical protein SLS62_002613 [Diatrype stigma]|uniref:Uncharacterized protein n=1 Tax=Diatrype stigma TaxID=117547 RepID=A0AAN9UXI4_9PEZI